MKKFLVVLLALLLMGTLVACGSSNNSKPADNASEATDASEEASGLDALIEAAQAEGELIVYGSCEEEYLSAACEHFEELYGIKVQYQRLSTGEVQSKIEEENGNPSGDVWFGGTTDPYNEACVDGLLEPYDAMNAVNLISDDLGVPANLLTTLYFECMESANQVWDGINQKKKS